jgi:hypothetical protein
MAWLTNVFFFERPFLLASLEIIIFPAVMAALKTFLF